MSQVEYYSAERRNWWEKLFGGLTARPDEAFSYSLPSDSLLNSAWSGAHSVADVPETVKAQIREEAVLTTFNRLEASLRLLLYATTPDRQPPTPEDCHQILNVWRYELEHQVNLTPDTYCGALQRYEPEMEAAYIIDGRCEPGSLLRIRVPCWRMRDRIVVRGEAELINGPEAGAPATNAAQASGPTAVAETAESAALAEAIAEPEAAPMEAAPMEAAAGKTESPAEEWSALAAEAQELPAPVAAVRSEAAPLKTQEPVALESASVLDDCEKTLIAGTWDELVAKARAEHAAAQTGRAKDEASAA